MHCVAVKLEMVSCIPIVSRPIWSNFERRRYKNSCCARIRKFRFFFSFVLFFKLKNNLAHFVKNLTVEKKKRQKWSEAVKRIDCEECGISIGNLTSDKSIADIKQCLRNSFVISSLIRTVVTEAEKNQNIDGDISHISYSFVFHFIFLIHLAFAHSFFVRWVKWEKWIIVDTCDNVIENKLCM